MNFEPNPAPLNPGATTTSTPAAHHGPRALWAAVAVLAVAVIAMGGVLLKQSPGDVAKNAAPATTSASNLAGTQPAPNDGIPPPLPVTPMPAVTTPAPDVPSAPAVAAQPASPAPMMAGASPQPASSIPAAIAPPAAPLCTVCGHVESVRTVQREQPTSGVGAVAGGVVGGVVGNQVGHGNGRTAATLLGAVGGGFLGNHIERRTHTLTRYEVTVRMDDGSRRTVETRSAPPIGKDVTLKGQVLRPANRHL
jgi:hypothetical protein